MFFESQINGEKNQQCLIFYELKINFFFIGHVDKLKISFVGIIRICKTNIAHKGG